MSIALLNEKKPEFNKAVDFLREELASMRTGRTNAALLDKIEIEAYDSKMPLKGVASISIPDAKTIIIEPWDAGLVQVIETALRQAELGMTPNVQGKMIRLVMPPMTEDRRKELVKVVKEKAEETRKAVRAVRERIRDEVHEMEKNKELTEDDRFQAQDELDKITKDFITKIEGIIEEKEKEIMTV
jgi:ribosome recycling factor